MTESPSTWAIHSGGPESPVRRTVNAPNINAVAQAHAQHIATNLKLRNPKIKARRIDGGGECYGTFRAIDMREGKFASIGDPFFIEPGA